jgi:DNA-binding beta-propeller fold protein YncE
MFLFINNYLYYSVFVILLFAVSADARSAQLQHLLTVPPQPASGYFNNVGGISIHDGNIYITDNGSHRIVVLDRYYNFVKSIPVYQGDGTTPLSKMGFIYVDDDHSMYVSGVDGTQYIAGRLVKISSDGKVMFNDDFKGQGTGLVFAVDESGSIYTTDPYYDGAISNMYYVTKYDADHNFLKGLVHFGGGLGQTGSPIYGIAAANNSFFAINDSSVQQFDIEGNCIAKFSGFKTACFGCQPAVDNGNNLYFYSDHKIYKTNATNFTLGVFFDPGSLDLGGKLAIDGDDNLYSANNNCIYKINSSGIYGTIGSCGTGQGAFNAPKGIALDSNNNTYVVDTQNNVIQKFSSGGAFITQWGGYGNGDGKFIDPSSIAVDSNNSIYVLDSRFRVQKFAADGSYINKFYSSLADSYIPYAFAVYGSKVYIACKYNDQAYKVKVYDMSGALVDTIQNLKLGAWFAVDKGGNYYTTNQSENTLSKYNSAGALVWQTFGGSSQLLFSNPSGVAVDNAGFIYVVDTGNNRIQQFTTDKKFVQAFGTQGYGVDQFVGPIGIVAKGKVIAVTDAGNNRYLVYDNPNASSDAKGNVSAMLLLLAD